VTSFIAVFYGDVNEPFDSYLQEYMKADKGTFAYNYFHFVIRIKADPFSVNTVHWRQQPKLE